MSLENFLQNNKSISTPLTINKITVFVASWCPHSKEACRILSNYKHEIEVYAVNLYAFVCPYDLNHIKSMNNIYSKYYNDYIEQNKDLYQWKYPHVFIQDNQLKWHYIGGEDATKAFHEQISDTIKYGI